MPEVLGSRQSLLVFYGVAQGVAFAGPAVCMVACAMLTPSGTAHAPGSSPTTLIVALFSAAFAMGAWARAGLYCNHQVQCSPCCSLRTQTMLVSKGPVCLAMAMCPNGSGVSGCDRRY